MSASGVPHEFIKYAISLILFISIFRSGRHIQYLFILFLILFIPGMFLSDGKTLEGTRQLISANLSGLLCLAISAIYFYKKPLDGDALRNLFLFILFPLASILGYLVVNTPDFSEIKFGYDSNFATSVYGPNQMSSVLGLGILLMGLAYFLKIRLFGSYLLALSYIGFLLFRGLLTFSRGGMITPLILLAIVFIYFTWKTVGFNRNTIRGILFVALFAVLAIFLFDYTDNLTGNKLSDRYQGIKRGKQAEDIEELTSGRTLIVSIDWKIFMENPFLGVGPGMGAELRKKYGYSIVVAAHNEFSRMLAEHGLFGGVAILILIVLPLQHFFDRKKILERTLTIAFVGFCFVFMTHAATRIAAPSFLYGVGFICVTSKLDRLRTYKRMLRKTALRKEIVQSVKID